jgi:hypothetical protein
VTRSPERKKEMSMRCATMLGISSRKKGARGSLDGDESNGEVVAALFRTGGKKLNCSRLAVTSVMRLGRGARGASTHQ